MTPAHIAAKFFRELTNRKVSIVDVSNVLILMVATYFIQLAAGRENEQLKGVDMFAEEVKNQIRFANHTAPKTAAH